MLLLLERVDDYVGADIRRALNLVGVKELVAAVRT